MPLPPDFERFVERDNALQTEPSASELGELPPRYLPDFGTITDGNAAPDADGAVALLIASGRRAAELELPVLAHVRSWSCRGCETPATGLAAVLALPAALKRAGLPDLAAFDLIEWDEKLAAELLACARACASRRFCEERLGRGPLGEIEPERRNVDGGSIATGHPASAAGARQVLRLALEMAQRDVALGLATVSSVEGQGAALILDRS